MFLQTVLGVCLLNLTTFGKGAQSICVPHISHVIVDETLAGRGVSPQLCTVNSAIWEQPSALNWVKDSSKAIVNGVNVLFLAQQLKPLLVKVCVCAYVHAFVCAFVFVRICDIQL